MIRVKTRSLIVPAPRGALLFSLLMLGAACSGEDARPDGERVLNPEQTGGFEAVETGGRPGAETSSGGATQSGGTSSGGATQAGGTSSGGVSSSGGAVETGGDGTGGSNADGTGGGMDSECTLATPKAGIPEISLFTPFTKSLAREDFCDAEQWYSEADGWQQFRLFEGDDFSANVPGGRKHVRIEAQHGLLFKPSDTWHEFEARMRIDETPEITITIAQLFAGCCGPDARVEMRTNGRIHLGSLLEGNVQLSDDQSYIGKSFKIKLRSNGKRIEAYFNGKLMYEGEPQHYKNGDGGNNLTFHFRWGLYSNDVPEHPQLTNTVTEVRRE